MYVEKEEKQEISLEDFEYEGHYVIAKAVGDIKTKSGGTTSTVFMEIKYVSSGEEELQKGMRVLYDYSCSMFERIDDGIYLINRDAIFATQKPK